MYDTYTTTTLAIDTDDAVATCNAAAAEQIYRNNKKQMKSQNIIGLKTSPEDKWDNNLQVNRKTRTTNKLTENTDPTESTDPNWFSPSAIESTLSSSAGTGTGRGAWRTGSPPEAVRQPVGPGRCRCTERGCGRHMEDHGTLCSGSCRWSGAGRTDQ